MVQYRQINETIKIMKIHYVKLNNTNCMHSISV